MDASRHSGLTAQRESVAMDVVRFAVDVVARLAQKEGEPGIEPRPDILEGLVGALCAADPLTLEKLRPQLRATRISPETFADVYIPAAARLLGDQWLRDEVSFTDVTVGASRLQSILRELSVDWSAEAARNSGHGRAATLLLVQPEGEHHTLGALVLATRLRRMGISVCLTVGLDPPEVRQLLRKRQVDGILISAGSQEKLETCRNLVKTIREGVGRSVGVAIGGAIVGLVDADAASLDVDVVTNDVALALRTFGLFEEAAADGRRV